MSIFLQSEEWLFFFLITVNIASTSGSQTFHIKDSENDTQNPSDENFALMCFITTSV